MKYNAFDIVNKKILATFDTEEEVVKYAKDNDSLKVAVTISYEIWEQALINEKSRNIAIKQEENEVAREYDKFITEYEAKKKEYQRKLNRLVQSIKNSDEFILNAQERHKSEITDSFISKLQEIQ